MILFFKKDEVKDRTFEGILLIDGYEVASCVGSYEFVSKDISHYYYQYLQDNPETIEFTIKEIKDEKDLY